MNTKPVYSSRSLASFWMIVFLTIGFLFVTSVLLYNIYQGEPIGWFPPALCGLLSIGGIGVIFNFPKYQVYHDRIEEMRIVGGKRRVHFFKDFKGWSEQAGQGKHGHYRRIHLHGGKKKFMIDSQMVGDVQPFVELLRETLPEMRHVEKQRIIKHLRLSLIIGSLFLAGLIYWSVTLYGMREDRITLDDCVEIRGVLSDKARVEGDEDNLQLLFALAEYPGMEFRLQSFSLDASYAPHFFQNRVQGDSIQVWVSTADYNLKILNLRKPRFYEKNQMDKLDVYNLHAEGYLYLDIENFNELQIEDRKIGMYILMGLTALLAIALVGIFIGFQRRVEKYLEYRIEQ